MAVSDGSTLPWVEKYRPRRLDDIVNQGEVVKALKNIVQTKNVPHMLFTGPPGTGKTATAHALRPRTFRPTIP
jgi:DNA polymerase III gamma/tau subunit